MHRYRPIKTGIFLCLALTLTSCANLHRYDKPDAASIERVCQLSPKKALDGNYYMIEIAVAGVDDHLPGTGVSCKDNPIHKINPAAQKIAFFATVQSPGTDFIHIGHPEMTVQLKPNTVYFVEYSFDGKKIQMTLKDKNKGESVASAETTNFQRQTVRNPALSLIPFLVK